MCIQEIAYDMWKEESSIYVCVAWVLCREENSNFDSLSENEQDRLIALKYIDIRYKISYEQLKLFDKYSYFILSNGIKNVFVFYNNESEYCPISDEIRNECSYFFKI